MVCLGRFAMKTARFARPSIPALPPGTRPQRVSVGRIRRSRALFRQSQWLCSASVPRSARNCTARSRAGSHAASTSSRRDAGKSRMSCAGRTTPPILPSRSSMSRLDGASGTIVFPFPFDAAFRFQPSNFKSLRLPLRYVKRLRRLSPEFKSSINRAILTISDLPESPHEPARE